MTANKAPQRFVSLFNPALIGSVQEAEKSLNLSVALLIYSVKLVEKQVLKY
jgi:hypothetical protein